MLTRETDLISTLLDASIRDLDITPEQFALAESLYLDLGEWLVSQGLGEPDVYPQGSFRLGTVLRPAIGNQFDIDLVFLRPLKKGSITQEELRDQAKSLLERYLKARGAAVGTPVLEEKGRCFTLVYEDAGFHMDVLPVIPDDEGRDGAILLSDRELRLWQHSNPIGYADWFWAVMGDSADAQHALLAEQMDRQVEDVPRWLVRTTLQRVVQLLKLNRDVFFADNPDQKPASILVTTLAARAHGGDLDLYTAFRKVAEGMAQHIERRGDEWWVENPAHASENFADKWNSDPQRKDQFFGWLRRLVHDVSSWSAAEGIDVAAAGLGASFGDGPVRQGAAIVAAAYAASTESGQLAATPTGGLTTKPRGIRVKQHDFHGE